MRAEGKYVVGQYANRQLGFVTMWHVLCLLGARRCPICPCPTPPHIQPCGGGRPHHPIAAVQGGGCRATTFTHPPLSLHPSPLFSSLLLAFHAFMLSCFRSFVISLVEHHDASESPALVTKQVHWEQLDHLPGPTAVFGRPNLSMNLPLTRPFRTG